MDITDLIKRAKNGEVAASRELLEMQRQGKALRLYPFGRFDAEHDGMSPVIFGRGQSGLIRFEWLKTGPLHLMRKDIAKLMRHTLLVSDWLWLDYSGTENPGQAIESQVAEDFEFAVWSWDHGIAIQFAHAKEPCVEFGLYHCKEILKAVLTIIEQSELEYSEFGFDDEDEYYDMLDFLVDDSEII